MKRIPVIIFGAGGVGAALLGQIVDARARVAERADCCFDVVALADSRTAVWAPAGLSDEHVLEIVDRKRAGTPAGDLASRRPSDLELLERLSAAGLRGAIMVDVTAAAGMEPVVDRALELGYGVALANKKIFAGPWQQAQKYYNHPRVRHESTVGGGQPVIATLRYLLDTNDPIYEIEGQLSGTLGFIAGRLDEGMPFSEAIRQAKSLGYTEPDPREDLGGMDVMRKVLILGRMAGWPLEPEDIHVESLYPASLAGHSVDDFLAAISQADEAMAQRVAAAAREGAVLRYVARLSEDRGTVGLQAVPANSPLAGLKYIAFRTRHYDDEKLLIGGKGAGVEMTAAGVLGDMVALVREVFRDSAPPE